MFSKHTVLLCSRTHTTAQITKCTGYRPLTVNLASATAEEERAWAPGRLKTASHS